MGKTLDELRGQMDERPLRPGEGVETKAKGDVRGQAWYSFAKDIEDLRASGEVSWAEDTLAGIQETVEHTHRVTEAQQRAVDNIAAKRRAPSQRSIGRRYEGYGGRYRS